MIVAVRRMTVVCALFALLSLLAGGATAVSTSAATLYVDQANPSCSNSGPGSPTQPLCTISASVPIATPGTTVQVAAGTYAEQVSPHTGASGPPIVFSAAPGATVTVTGKSYGFYLSNLSWVTINGFSVTGTTNQGIYVTGSSNVTITGNHVTLSGRPVSGQTKSGIYLTNTSSSLVSGNTTDHNSDAGIQLSTGSTGDEVRGNVTFQNAQVWQRQAAGIRLYKSPGNIVDGNITHDNEDSGMRLTPDSRDCSRAGDNAGVKGASPKPSTLVFDERFQTWPRVRHNGLLPRDIRHRINAFQGAGANGCFCKLSSAGVQ